MKEEKKDLHILNCPPDSNPNFMQFWRYYKITLIFPGF